MSRQARHVYEFGQFRLEEAERRLLRDGRPVPLPPKVFETLLLLVQRSGHVVEKDEIMKTIWPDSFVEEANLTQYVFALRRALGEGESGGSYIETVSKHGYRFAANVRETEECVADADSEGLAAEQSFINDGEASSRQDQALSQTLRGVADRRRPKTVRWTRRPVTIAGSILLLGLAIASLYLWGSGAMTGTEAGFRSIAVLPFKTLDGTGDNEHLGLGMTDAFINRLSSIRQIDVRPTRAILKYNGDHHDLLAAGRELGVDAVLDGSVLRAGDRVRVTVQLVRVRDGMPLWADKFDTKFTDIFSVQDSVSEQVAQALTLTLNVEESKQLVKRPTNNAEAYQAYLKGRYFWNKRSAENYKKAIEHFDQAIELDAQYSHAYAGLADAYALLGSMGNADLPRREAMHRARSAATKALTIDETLAEAHTSLAFVKMQYDWDWPGAEKEFKRAIELNPSYATAHHWFAYYFAAVGRHDEAIRESRRAQEIDPLSLIINTDVADRLFYAGRYDEAIDQCRKTIEMDENFTLAYVVLGLVYAEKGMHGEAITELQKAASLSEDETSIIASLGQIYAMTEKKDEARRMLDKLRELSLLGYVPSSDLALVHAGLGENDQAFALLEKAYEDRSGSLMMIKVWPQLKPLRSDPRFADLVRRIGLAP